MKRLLTYLLTLALAINPAVLRAFYADGGTIVQAYAITVDGQACWGCYCDATRQIRIRTDAPEGTLAHEIGHWLYDWQVWSGTLQEHAGQAFAATPLQTLTGEHFAMGYEMYCTGRLEGRLAEFYKELEAEL